MGPEPSYVKDGVNGWTFEKNDPSALEAAIRAAIDSSDIEKVRNNSYLTFQEIHRVSYASEMAEVIEEAVKLSSKSCQ